MLTTLPLLFKQASRNVKLLSAKQAAIEIQKNEGLLIDVREPAEYLASSAFGAINMPRGVVEMKILELEKDSERPIFLHCASSLRAVLAAEQLARIGYTNVNVISCKMDEILKMNDYSGFDHTL